jgi:hypothetical protein
MRPLIGTGLILTLALAGCGKGSEEPDSAQTIVAETADEYQQKILGLDEGQRNAVFIRAIRDAGVEGSCQGVETSAYVGKHDGAPMWTARCTDGSDWAILLGPAGTAQVMACAAAEQAGLPSCATRPTA